MTVSFSMSVVHFSCVLAVGNPGKEIQEINLSCQEVEAETVCGKTFGTCIINYHQK